MSHPRQPGGRAAGPREAAAPRSRPSEGSSPGKEKDPRVLAHKAAAAQGSRQAALASKPPAAAYHRVPSRRPLGRLGVQHSLALIRGASRWSRYPQRSRPGPRSRPPPSVASPQLLPDKKSYRSPAPLGPGAVLSAGLTGNGSPSSASRAATCLARNDSDGCCSE